MHSSFTSDQFMHSLQQTHELGIANAVLYYLMRSVVRTSAHQHPKHNISQLLSATFSVTLPAIFLLAKPTSSTRGIGLYFSQSPTTLGGTIQVEQVPRTQSCVDNIRRWTTSAVRCERGGHLTEPGKSHLSELVTVGFYRGASEEQWAGIKQKQKSDTERLRVKGGGVCQGHCQGELQTASRHHVLPVQLGEQRVTV